MLIGAKFAFFQLAVLTYAAMTTSSATTTMAASFIVAGAGMLRVFHPLIAAVLQQTPSDDPNDALPLPLPRGVAQGCGRGGAVAALFALLAIILLVYVYGLLDVLLLLHCHSRHHFGLFCHGPEVAVAVSSFSAALLGGLAMGRKVVGPWCLVSSLSRRQSPCRSPFLCQGGTLASLLLHRRTLDIEV